MAQTPPPRFIPTDINVGPIAVPHFTDDETEAQKVWRLARMQPSFKPRPVGHTRKKKPQGFVKTK